MFENYPFDVCDCGISNIFFSAVICSTYVHIDIINLAEWERYNLSLYRVNNNVVTGELWQSMDNNFLSLAIFVRVI